MSNNIMYYIGYEVNLSASHCKIIIILTSQTMLVSSFFFSLIQHGIVYCLQLELQSIGVAAKDQSIEIQRKVSQDQIQS